MFPLCTHHKQGKWEQSCSTELKCALGVPSRCSYYRALCSAFQSSEECVSERRTFAPFYQSAVQCIELIVFIWLLPEASSEQKWYSLPGLRRRVPTDGGKVGLAWVQQPPEESSPRYRCVCTAIALMYFLRSKRPNQN